MKIKREDLMPELDPAIEQIIQKLANSGIQPHRIVKRATIIKLLAEGNTIINIAKKVDLHRNRVALWRARFIEALPEINETYYQEGQKECQKLIINVLSDKPRSGAPKKFTKEDQNSVIATACLNPADLGPRWPISQWSNRTLAMFLTEEGLVSDISSSTVGRILKSADLKPYKHKMWIHSPDKITNLEEYIEQVREISSLIKSSQDFYSQGVQIISIDEKPGIQALSPIYPTLPAQPGKPPLKEMFYSRNGRLDLIQALNIATGEVFEPYLNETHKEEDFINSLSKVLEQQKALTPDDQIIIICDNFSTHCSESLVRLIDQELNLQTPTSQLGKKGSSGILKNKQTRRSFLADKSHKIYFAYTPKHASWLDPVECYFSILHRDLLKNASFESTDSIREKIKAYTVWYNEHSARPFDYQFDHLEKKIQSWISAAQ